MAHRETAKRRSRSVRGLILVIFSLGVLGLLWLRANSARERALQDLTRSERAALYARTLENLREVCQLPLRKTGLSDYCEGQARFAVEFPECDEQCKNLAAPYLAQPSR
jgi:hypothetical protein